MTTTAMSKAKQAVAKAPEQTAGKTLADMLQQDSVKDRFNAVLGAKASGFTASILSLYNATPQLQASDPRSILSSAMISATLDLPINPNLGFAHLIPYKGVCQFQMGWRGFVQLAMRTGQYKTINASEVYEGEIKTYNRITGEMEFDLDAKKSDKVVGFVAYFKLLNGFEKYLYMTREAVEAHGKKYSKSYTYDSSPWQTLFNSMALKTVLKMLLGKFGILSIQLQKAIIADQGVPQNLDATAVTYPDSLEENGKTVAEIPADIDSQIEAELKTKEKGETK